ncbi:LysR family transcriptional regulator [Vibrio sp. DW001]|uniref:LysR family transcriptional regulator n=1 Tax=Vibrio sp. DW001 TaxID=2912315 RepID=UPI0023AF929D|nr:LysR family transcriptional regulator [Vibrio sp. DW001]WED28805.1 LysR family transcriptional regulator [Vibrio sp. DW001]
MKDNIQNIRHLRAFFAISECKSISKATDVVFLSQPAITQAISKLETALDTSLFDRKSTGMYTTQSGDILANRVSRALDILREGIRESIKYGSEKKGANAQSLLSLITTTQLKALIAISSAKSFSSAGREVGVSQSSLHRSGRDLESLLGVTLFEKTSFGISPTKAALALMRAAKLAFSEINQGKVEISALNNIEIGHMFVGSMPLARTSILPNAIIEFTHHHPDFNFSIYDGPYDDLLSHLRFADVDMLIGALRFPSPSEDVIQEELFSSNVVIVAHPDHPCVSDTQLDLEKLSRGSWVIPRKGAPTRTIFENLFSEAEVPAPIKIVESNSHILIRSLLQGSERMTMISEHQVQQELDTGLLCVVPFPIKHANRPIGITVRKEWKPTATQKQFLDILKEKGIKLAVEEP